MAEQPDSDRNPASPTEGADDSAPRDEAASSAAAAPKRKKRKKRPADPPQPAAPDPIEAKAAARRTLLLRVGAVLAATAVLAAVLLFIQARRRPKAVTEWEAGDVVDVEITLVSSDARNLACAAKDQVGGRHCAFETSSKPWSADSAAADDKTVLKPYTTTNRVSVTAAGLWSEPALQGKLPTARFSVKCKYKVEGKLKNPSIRWTPTGPWIEQDKDWPSGIVSECTILGDGGA